MGKVYAVVAAAGRSTRMGGRNKQLMTLFGVPVLALTLRALEEVSRLDGIVLAAPQGSVVEYRGFVKNWGLKKIIEVVPGGDDRQQSVYSGLLAVPSGCGLVLVHDGARPLVSCKEIEDVLTAAAEWGAATLAVPVKDTVKEVDHCGFVARTPDREKLWLTLTPQGFSCKMLMDAHIRARGSGAVHTDDASLVESAGHKVRLVKGSYSNIKITTPEDLAVAEGLLKLRDGNTCGIQNSDPHAVKNYGVTEE